MSPESRWATAELVATVVLPGFALIFLTDQDRLGPTVGLVVALVPPILWGIVSMVREGQVSALAVLALVSVLLTGGVGLLRLDAGWFALKEAAVPVLIGVGTFVTATTRYAVVPILLARMFDLDRVYEAAEARGTREALESTLVRATRLAGGVLVGTAVVTWALARFMVQSETGTEAFADELGQYTLVSVPALLIPSTVLMAWVLSGVLGAVESATGEEPDAFLR